MAQSLQRRSHWDSVLTQSMWTKTPHGRSAISGGKDFRERGNAVVPLNYVALRKED